MRTFQHIPGLIAVQCILRSDDNQVIGKGVGASVFTRINKSVERTCLTTINAAYLSAANNCCKVLDSLRLDLMSKKSSEKTMYNETYPPVDAFVPASERQVAFLKDLIQTNVVDEEERERWLSQLSELTRDEASQAIEQFKR